MIEKHLYTIILDYLGGTYISQIIDATPDQALEQWAESVPDKHLAAWHLKRDALLEVISSNTLVALKDHVNVWCQSGVDNDDRQLLLNIISTVQS